MKIRGYVALVLILMSFVPLDLVQRLILGPWVRLVPRHRIGVLTRWQRFMAWWVMTFVSKVGGADLPDPLHIPGEDGTLVLMNHQSVLDIPLVVSSIRGSYPRIVTRKRYLRWIPLISHMVRLYQYPVVDPSANPSQSKKMLAGIRDAARTTDVPFALFPEGTRTKDGEIGPFRTTGLKLVLRQRPWTVYLLVGDGYWERAKLKHFLSGMHDIRGTLRLLGPFVWDDPRGDSEAFIEEMRAAMVAELHRMRGGEEE